MNKAEAKRVAHCAVAALVRVHLEFTDNDLWSGGEDWSETDRDRFAQACRGIASYHTVQSQPMTPGRKAAETRRRRADREPGIKARDTRWAHEADESGSPYLTVKPLDPGVTTWQLGKHLGHDQSTAP